MSCFRSRDKSDSLADRGETSGGMTRPDATTCATKKTPSSPAFPRDPLGDGEIAVFPSNARRHSVRGENENSSLDYVWSTNCRVGQVPSR